MAIGSDNRGMISADLDPEKFYAMRQAPGVLDRHMLRVRVVGPVRKQKVKVRHVDGELEGLEEWVTTRSLVSEWGVHASIQRDERQLRELLAVSNAVWESGLEGAVDAILGATGEDACWDRRQGLVLLPIVAERLWNRARLDGEPEHERHAYRDQKGMLHLSFATAVRLAQAFAKTEPEPCLLSMRNREEELRISGFQPGMGYRHDALIRVLVPHAVARDWISAPLTLAVESELYRVRGLLGDAIGMLKQAGNEDAAARLERATQRRR